MMNQKLNVFALLAGYFLLLVSCTVYDPRYRELAATASISPDPNAILGVWHNFDDGSVVGSGRQNLDLMFVKSGKGHAVFLVTGIPFAGSEKVDEFTWKYSGNGLWTSHDLWGNYNKHEFRISGDRLLHKLSSFTGDKIYRVFNRVEANE